jgi:hypothetical protein
VIEVTAEDGVNKKTYTIIYTQNTTSIEARKNGLYTLYPNPAGNFIQIEYPFTKGSSIKINIYNLTGQLLLQQDFSGENVRIDIGSLSPGLYFISLQEDTGPGEVKTFIKE